MGACGSEAQGSGPPVASSRLLHPQALRSFKLSITVDPKYHPKIIGRKGAVITQIRLEHDVNVQFPDKDDGSQVRRPPDGALRAGGPGGLCPDLRTVPGGQDGPGWAVSEQGPEWQVFED